MKRKIISTLFALVLALSLSLVTAVPASAADTPTIDGTVSAGEWDGAVEIDVAGTEYEGAVMGTVKLLASTDYLYVLFEVLDSTDGRLGGRNDKIGFNINPTDGGEWGKPYDIVFQTSADPDAFTTPDPDIEGSSGSTDEWKTEWVIDGVQLDLPEDLETMTFYGGGKRISEWKVPLATIDLSMGDTLLVGGACDNLNVDAGSDGGTFSYPPNLEWAIASTFAEYSLKVENETTSLYYQTIQAAIATASEGDTINVAAGTYQENVVVDRSLTLQGEDRGTTEIKFGYGDYPSEPPLTISADEVTVSGFTIRSGPYIEKALGAPGGYAHTIIVTGDSALLTDLHVIKEPLLTYNNVPRIGGSAFLLTPGLDGFTFTYSTVDSDWNGIYAREGSSNIEVRKVDFTYPGEWAILLKMITGATIEENTFTCTADKYGVTVTRGSSGIGIVDNEFIGSGSLEGSHTGILLQAFATGTMGDVTILSNGISDFNTGILVEDVVTSGISIHGNSIVDNTCGVNYLGSDTIDATNNWWGDATGPDDDAEVINGSGDKISTNVDAQPWYATETTNLERQYVTVKVGDTEEVRAYSDTIQDGIDAALDGDTVNVAAGTYNESPVIDVNDLTLQSSSSPLIQGGFDVQDGADDVTIDGFTIQPTSGDAVHVRTAGNVTVTGCTIVGLGATGGVDGIVYTHSAPATAGTVTDNIISDCELAIYLDHDGLYDFTVTGNTVEDSRKGIGLGTLSGATIDDNDVSGCTQIGIEIRGSANITNNTVQNNQVGIWVGSDVEIHSNNIEVNIDYGIQNVGVELLDATNNWWGNVSGPEQATTNPSGTGDLVSDDVVYSPWLGATLGTTPMTFVELVTSTDPDPVTLLDDEGDTIAEVDISGGDASSGTIAANSEPDDPAPTSLSVGTGKTGVVFLDVKVTGYSSGMAHIIVPYPDADDDGIVDDTGIVETTLGLYYWDEAASMWRIAANSEVDPDENNVSGDIPVSALAGTPIGGGGYPADEAIVAIVSITNLSYSGNDIVDLTITTGSAQLGAVTIDLTFDNTVVEVLGGENSEFDSLTVNPNYSVSGNMQTARFVANQLGPTGVDATGKAVLAQVRLKAVGTTGSSSSLTLDVITLKDNDGISIPYVTPPTDGTATIGGLGDANSDGYVDAYDCVFTARAIAGIPAYSLNEATMDVSGDGELDAFDCTYLARHIAGIVGYEQLGG